MSKESRRQAMARDRRVPMPFLLLCCSVSLALVDLNRQQLQLIADHLTHAKCFTLMEALNETKFQLDADTLPKATTSSTPSMGVTPKESIPCVDQLSAWSQGAGKFQTFDFLVLRLKEIGMPKLASKVSRIVLHETWEELHRYYLDDPFKAMIPTQSMVVAKPDKQFKEVPARDVTTADDGMFHVVIIVFIVCLFLLVCLTCCVLYAKTGHYVCQRICPNWVTAIYEAFSDGFLRCWSGSKKNIARYTLGSPRGDQEGLAI